MLRRFFSGIFIGLLAVSSALTVRAIDPEPFTVPVGFSIKVQGGDVYATMTVYGEGNSPTVEAHDIYTPESPAASIPLRPGKSYPVNFHASALGAFSYSLSFVAPSGYQVFLDGYPKDLFSGANSFDDPHFIEVRPVYGAGFLDAGVFTGIEIGQAISWELGLGGSNSGHSVGRVSFRELDLSNNPSSRDRLVYVPPINTGQVNVIRDGPSNQRIRQIAAPKKILDFVDDNTGGYWVKYYNYDDADQPPGNLYVFGSSKVPWRTIHVESPGPNQLLITETEGGVSRVSELKLLSSVAAPTGGSVYSSGGYTIHSFTTAGAFTANAALSVEALVVAGGGGGGGSLQNTMNGGGGGAGGLLHDSAFTVTPGAYPITVGAGGASGVDGENSTFASLIAIGGGHGADSGYGRHGSGGGSGGGTATGGQGSVPGTPTAGQGNYGGWGGEQPGDTYAGGGGGALYPGGAYLGGWGLDFSTSGFTRAYAGGGGGGSNFAEGQGDSSGGGGLGGGLDYAVGEDGAPHSGGGGGGGGASNYGSYAGGAGGSGVVVIRYPSSRASNIGSGYYELQLREGDGTSWLRTTTHTSTTTGPARENLVTIRTGGANGTVVSETKYIYHVYPWGDDLYQVVVNPNGGSDALTTTYAYYDGERVLGSETNRGSYSRVKSITYPTGDWVAYEYYDEWDLRGQVKHQYQPYLDSPSAVSFNAIQGRVKYFQYTPDITGRSRRPSLVRETINGVRVSETQTTYDDAADVGLLRLKADVKSYYGDGSTDFIQTHTERIDPLSGDIDQSGEPCVLKNPDGSQSSWSRLVGEYDQVTHAFTANAGSIWYRELKVNGSTSSIGGELQSSYGGQTFAALYLVPYKSTVEITIRDVAGYVIRNETRAYIGSGAWSPTLNSVDTLYDVKCRPYLSTANNGATTSYTYFGGRAQTVIGGDGVETRYTYDGLGRVATVKKVGVAASGIHAAQADVTTTYTYDGADRVTDEIRSATGTSETIVNTSKYDLAGRQIEVTPAGLAKTLFSYNAASRTQTTTAPDGGTVIQTTHRDGRPKQVEGTATVARYYSYSVETNGQQLSQVNSGAVNSPRLQKTWGDWLGRVVKTEHPGFSKTSQAAFVEQRFYDATKGLLKKTTATGSAPVLYVYNTLGQLLHSGLDIDIDIADSLVFASKDRISASDTSFENYSGAWWLKTTTSTFPVANQAAAITTSVTRQRLTGFAVGRLSETQAIDAEGNTAISFTDIGGKLLTTTTSVTGISNLQTGFSYNGLASAVTGEDGLTSKIQYDELGRPKKTVDARGLVTTTAYYSGTARVNTITDSASNVVSTLGYDTSGRVIASRDAANHYSRVDYNERGQVKTQWGDAAIPVSYGYDSVYGERTSMSTYRSAPAVDSVIWPAVGGADTTLWAFDPATGLLWQKTDAANHTVELNYNVRGQVSLRKLARGLTTQYDYDPLTGELKTQTYPNSTATPSVTYDYNRLGQPVSVTDGTGQRFYHYDPAKPWRLNDEKLSGYFADLFLSRTYDSLGRDTGFKLGAAAGDASTLQQNYGFVGSNGRFNTLTSGRASNAVSETFTYSYVANTPFVKGYDRTNSSFAVSRTYENDRNVLQSIDSQWGGTSLTRYDFTTNALGQRKTAKQSGTAFSDYYAPGYSSVFNHYSYNARGELETSALYRGDNVPALNASADPANELPGRRYEYRYDAMGNRLNAGSTGNPALDEEYSPNALNQYEQKENNLVRVTGTSATDVTIAVAGVATVSRKDRAWSAELIPANIGTAVMGTVALYASSLSGSATSVLKTDSNESYFVPKAAQTFLYDEDGNMKHDSVWDYTYDAENRLIAMQHRPEVIDTTIITTANARRLEFQYDYMGRRVAKIVKGGLNGGSYPTTLSYAKFLYDGWNLVAEYTGASATTLGTLVRAYTWGLDTAGSLTATGGVGALVQLYDAGTSKTYLPTYDGNGNVVSMVNATSGALEAVYEYSPFGEPIRSEGAYAATNPIRFSTKYTDLETGLSYYGHRYYSPTLGRFINRDPIEEFGGLNLYGFCANDGVNCTDFMGLHWELRTVRSWNPKGTSSDANGNISDDYSDDVMWVWVNDPDDLTFVTNRPPSDDSGSTQGNGGGGTTEPPPPRGPPLNTSRRVADAPNNLLGGLITLQPKVGGRPLDDQSVLKMLGDPTKLMDLSSPDGLKRMDQIMRSDGVSGEGKLLAMLAFAIITFGQSAVAEESVPARVLFSEGLAEGRMGLRMMSAAESRLFPSGGDRLLSSLGPARLNNAEELAATIQRIEAAGGTVESRAGSLAFSPARGAPGNVILDPTASISAVRHEAGHFFDDLRLGSPGMGYYMQNPSVRWASERASYLMEIRTARLLGDQNARSMLIQDALTEKRAIFGP